MNELKAIEILNEYIEDEGVDVMPSKEDCEAFRLAITALQERIAKKAVRHAFDKASIKHNINIKIVEGDNE